MAGRAVSRSKYTKMAAKLADCLNTKNIPKSLHILSNTSFFAMRPTNGTAYLEYDGHEVKDHIMIVPIDDDVTSIIDFDFYDFNRLRSFILEIQEYTEAKKYILTWKNEEARTISKWHAHFVVI